MELRPLPSGTPPPFPQGGEPCEISVSIINYRTADLTLQCLRSVLDDLRGHDGHVIVVDNHSNDGSAETIADWLSSQATAVPVTLVRSVVNSGFSGGHNIGLSAHKAEVHLVLNSDTLVRPGFFAAILKAARDNPTAGFVAPRIEHDDGTPQISCFRFPSPASELIRAAASGPITRLLKRYDMPLGAPPSGPVGWASFACILLRGDMIAALGPMDEGYFLYFEDVEYCLRARRAGWSIFYTDTARAVHFRGGSGPVKELAREARRLPGYYYASRTRFFRQAYGPTGPVVANLMWHLGRGIAQLRRLSGRAVPAANAGEARDIWTNVTDPLGDRLGGRPPSGS